ncbi:MAG: hypothetical protein ABL925_18565 [Methylococcales bacterium]
MIDSTSNGWPIPAIATEFTRACTATGEAKASKPEPKVKPSTVIRSERSARINSISLDKGEKCRSCSGLTTFARGALA